MRKYACLGFIRQKQVKACYFRLLQPTRLSEYFIHTKTD